MKGPGPDLLPQENQSGPLHPYPSSFLNSTLPSFGGGGGGQEGVDLSSLFLGAGF